MPEVHQARTDPARTLRLVFAAAAAGLIVSTVAAKPRPGPWSPVRHPGRQLTVAPVLEQHPIHYPRSARMAATEANQRPSDRLLGEFFELHTAMAYEEAARVAEQLIELSPNLAQAHYNHACVMGRLHRGDEAASSLERAVSLGWRDLVHLSIDPDLDCIRDTTRYSALLTRLRKLVAADGPSDEATMWPGRIADLYREIPRMLSERSNTAATVAIFDGATMIWNVTIARGPVRLVANADNPTPNPTRTTSLPARLMADPAPTADWLGIITSLGREQGVTRWPEGDYLELADIGADGVGLLRWSPSLGCGVLVVTGDRTLAGQIASVALGQGGPRNFSPNKAETGRGNPNN